MNKPSKVSWRIHRVSMKLQQKGIVVPDGLTSFVDVVRDVTPLKCKFLGPRMETKNCNHARRDMEEPRHLPRSLPRVSASDENTLRHCQVAQKTRSGYPRTLWSTPGQMFGPLALLIVAPSFILSVALEGKRLTNRTAATKTT